MKNIITVAFILFAFVIYGQSPEVDSERFRSKTNAEETAFPLYSAGARLIYNSQLSKWRYKVGAGSWQDLDTGGGGGSGGIGTADQIVSRGTAIYNTATSSDVIYYRQEGNNLMKIGNNNDAAVYLKGIEALSVADGGTDFIDIVGKWRLPQIDTGVELATNWEGGIVRQTGTNDVLAAILGAWVKLTADDKISNTISGRTGTAISAAMFQTEAQLITDGDSAADEIVFCSDCPPMETQTATTFDVDDYRGIDDRATDTATFTFQGLKAGSVVVIEIDRATVFAISGLTPTNSGWASGFVANTRQSAMIMVQPSGDAFIKITTIE